jgi:hypothetical protein
MAGELRTITFAATTLDTQHWHPGWRAAADATTAGDYHDWAFDGLVEAMRLAGQKYIDEHPDLFACELT